MSELINNREKHSNHTSERLQLLEEIFTGLYHGMEPAEVEALFDQKIGKVTLDEMAHLSDFHKQMVVSGSLTPAEEQHLSNAHMEILKGKIEGENRAEDEPGHPIHTFTRENRELQKLVDDRFLQHLKEFADEDSAGNIEILLEDCSLLLEVDNHYVRKEHLIFPYLEKYGIYGPSTNMWRLNDFARDTIKLLKLKLENYSGDKLAVIETARSAGQQVVDMVYREENILFPMCLDKFTEDEWVKIEHESDEIGYTLIEKPAAWKPKRSHLEVEAMSEGYIKLETGLLSLKQMELLLNHLPVDITFIDDQDVVRYFSFGKERIFPRTKAVIGRTVQNCHPPKSVHVVEELLRDFKSGKKDSEDFWIKFRDKYVYIRYFAVRDEDGKYVGTLEFTQNIMPIQAIEGEKRILALD